MKRVRSRGAPIIHGFTVEGPEVGAEKEPLDETRISLAPRAGVELIWTTNDPTPGWPEAEYTPAISTSNYGFLYWFLFKRDRALQLYNLGWTLLRRHFSVLY